MQLNYDSRILARVTAAMVTVAAFAKTFIPFYLIGSTAVFAAFSTIGVALVVMSGRPIRRGASHVVGILVVMALFYGAVIANFLLYSRPTVPLTHLLGILIFHAMFLIFGFAAARALKTTLLTILAAAAVYSILIIRHTVQFGDVMRDNYLHDVFGVGDQVIFTTFHQNIGTVLGLGILAAVGLASDHIKRAVAFGSVPIVLLFTFHIAARAALIALLASLAFWGVAAIWVRSKKAATLSIALLIIAITTTSGVFYERALRDNSVDPVAPDAISRTVRELQNPDRGFRMQIWGQALHQIVSDPDLLLFGRGIGMYPVNEGFGAPDWLLHPTEGSKHYPHNVHLEMLYDAGIVGLLLFSILTLAPIVASLRYWSVFPIAKKSGVAMYVFALASADISGGFAYTYMLQFFLSLTVGIIAVKRTAAPTREMSH